MPNYRMPDGRTLNVPDNVTDKEYADILTGLADIYPDHFGQYAPDRSLGGHVSEFVKGIPRGFGSSLITAAEGITGLLTPGVDTGLERALRSGRQYWEEDTIFAADPQYTDAYSSQLGSGLGSFASFLIPGGAAKLIGSASKGLSAAAKADRVRKLTTRGAFALAIPMGMGEQAQRVQASKEAGVEVSGAQEFISTVLGGGVGATEVLPLFQLFKGLRKGDQRSERVRDFIYGAAKQGGSEGAQEAVAGIFQDVIQSGIYDPSIDIGDSMFSDFTVGGGVGAIVDTTMRLINRKGTWNASAVTKKKDDLQSVIQELSDAEFDSQIDEWTTALAEQRATEPDIQPEGEPITDPMRLIPPDAGVLPGQRGSLDVDAGQRFYVRVNENNVYEVVDSTTGEALPDPRLSINPDNISQESLMQERGPYGMPYLAQKRDGKYIVQDPLLRETVSTHETLEEALPRARELSAQHRAEILSARLTREGVQKAADMMGKGSNQPTRIIGEKMMSSGWRTISAKQLSDAFGSSQDVLKKNIDLDQLIRDRLNRVGIPVKGAYSIAEAKKILSKPAFDQLMFDTAQQISEKDARMPDDVKSQMAFPSEVKEEQKEAADKRRKKSSPFSIKAKVKQMVREATNIDVDFDSPAFKTFAENVVGTRDWDQMSLAQKTLVGTRLMQLPYVGLDVRSGRTPEGRAIFPDSPLDARLEATDPDIGSAERSVDRSQARLDRARLAREEAAGMMKVARTPDEKKAARKNKSEADAAYQAALKNAQRAQSSLASFRREALVRRTKKFPLPDFTPKIYSYGQFQAALTIGANNNGVITIKSLRDQGLTQTQAKRLLDDLISSGRAERVGNKTVLTMTEEQYQEEQADIDSSAKVERPFRSNQDDQNTIDAAIDQPSATDPLIEEKDPTVRDEGGPLSFTQAVKSHLKGSGLGKWFDGVLVSSLGGAYGEANPFTKEILVSLSDIKSTDPIEEQVKRIGAVMDHESIHALFELDLFTEREWNTLTRFVTTGPGRDRYLKPAIAAYTKPLTDQGYSPEEVDQGVIEEAIAEAYREWSGKEEGVPPTVRKPFQKMLDAAWAFMRGGMDSGGPEAVFERIQEGLDREPGATIIEPENVETAEVRSLRAPTRGSIQQEPELIGGAADLPEPIGRQMRRTRAGQYIGAPEGIDTPQKLGGMRRLVNNLSKEGEPGRFWYERSGQEILDLVDGDKNEAEKIVQAIAVTSANTPVASNFQYAMQAYYQNKAGLPIETGMFPTAMSKKLEDIFAGKSWEGRKTNNFYNNLMRVIDPSRAQGATIDVWMMRAFGFKGDAPTSAQYDFAEKEVQRIADRLGWEPQQVQASIWVALKTKMDSREVRRKTEEISIRRGHMEIVERKGKKVRKFFDKEKHRQIWFDQAMKHSPTLQERESARFDYGDALNQTTAQISWESRPGRTTDHFSESFTSNNGVINQYHKEISDVFLDEGGNDIVSKSTKVLSPGDFEAPGYFEEVVSPGTQTLAVAPRRYRGEAVGDLDPSAAENISAYAAARGILMKQDSVGWHRPFFVKNLTRPKANGVSISIGRPFSARETSELAERLKAITGHNAYNPIASPDGVRLLNFHDGTSNQDFHKIYGKALEDMSFDNNERFEAKLFAAQTGYLENDWSVNKNGEGYMDDSSFGGRPDLQRAVRDIVRKLQPRIDSVDRAFADKYGWTFNESINDAWRQDPGVEEAAPPVEDSPLPPENEAQQQAVDQVEEDARSAPRGSVPRFNPDASPLAIEEAVNFEKRGDRTPTPLDPKIRGRFMLNKYEDAKTPGSPVNFRRDKMTFGEKLIQAVMAPGQFVEDQLKEWLADEPVREEGGFAQAKGTTRKGTAIRKAFINKRAWWERHQWRLEDLGRGGSELFRRLSEFAEQSAFKMIMFADRAEGTTARAMSVGKIEWLGSSPTDGYGKVTKLIDPESGEEIKGFVGAIESLIPLIETGVQHQGKTVDAIYAWSNYAASKRVEELKKTRAKLPGGYPGTEESRQEWIKTGDNNKAISEAYRRYQLWNNSLVDFGQKTGLLDATQAEHWRNQMSYFPFYREADLGHKHPLHEQMKGSETEIQESPLTTIPQNAYAIIYGGFINSAKLRLLRDLEHLGDARRLPNKEGFDKNPSGVMVRENGEPVYWEVDDIQMYDSLMTVSDGNSMPWLSLAAKPANFLREMVTRDPGFMGINILRDTLTTWVTSGANYRPFIASIKNAFSGNLEELYNAGVAGGYDFSNDPDNMKAFTTREILKQQRSTQTGGQTPIQMFTRMWDALGQASSRSDAATRLAVHDKVLEETGMAGEAYFQALEVINFSRRGDNQLMRIITATIPFLNARVQGLDVLYRSGIKGRYTARRQSALTPQEIRSGTMKRGAMIMGLTGLYWLMVHDDEEYINQRVEIRDDNWIISLGKDLPALTLPIPFEVGVIFKTIPERALDLAFGSTTDREFADSLVRSVGTTFAMNPLGFQFIAPVWEAYVNRSGYTGRAIVPHYMEEQVEAGLQSRPETNALITELGEALNISPLKMEYIMSGYGGTIGGYLLQVADAMTRVVTGKNIAGTRADLNPLDPRSVDNFPVIKRLLERPGSSRGVTQRFYEMRNELDMTIGTINRIKERGDTEELMAYRESRMGLLASQSKIRSIERQLTRWRKQRQRVLDSDIPYDEKKVQLEAIEQRIEAMAPAVEMIYIQSDLPVRLTGT